MRNPPAGTFPGDPAGIQSAIVAGDSSTIRHACARQTAPVRSLPPMADSPDLSVVVTLLNEQASLEELYRRTVSALDGKPFELILVDDGSTDGTWAEVERLHAGDPRVHAVRFKRNFGQHPAMHAGLARARGDIVVTMDGDLQNQPEDIPRLVAAVEAGADVASGRRAARNDSWGRTLPSRLINGMLRRFTGVDIADFGCAFNAYRREITHLIEVESRKVFAASAALAGAA